MTLDELVDAIMKVDAQSAYLLGKRDAYMRESIKSLLAEHATMKDEEYRVALKKAVAWWNKERA